MTATHLVEQDRSRRQAAAQEPSHEQRRELEERTLERLLATTRAIWLHNGRDGEAQRSHGEYAAA